MSNTTPTATAKRLTLGFGGGFHNAGLRYFRAEINGDCAYLSARQNREIANHMCGISDCQCGGGYGESLNEIPNGWEWVSSCEGLFSDGTSLIARRA